jgi:Uma2 family endonuclease
MASGARIRSGMSLAEFLEWDRIDEKPYLEYLEGRIEVKVSPRALHSVLEDEITNGLNQVALAGRLGRAFPELRCTYAVRSIVADVAFLLDDHIQVDQRGRFVDEIFVPPDIHVEIRSPRKSHKASRDKLAHSTAHGCPLGWYLDPYRETIEVFQPGLPPERLDANGYLEGAPVLPGFRVAVSEIFGWLIYRKPGSNPS